MVITIMIMIFNIFFIGVEEVNDDNNKVLPSLPIIGIEEGKLEKCKNILNSLRFYLYPNVDF